MVPSRIWRPGRRRPWTGEALEPRQLLAALVPGDPIYPQPRAIIEYGSVLELQGDEAYVGDLGEDALFVLRESNGSWTTRSIIEPDRRFEFPYALAIDGDLLAAISVDFDDGHADARAEIYRRAEDSVWNHEASLSCHPSEVLSLSAAIGTLDCGSSSYEYRQDVGWEWSLARRLPLSGKTDGNRLVSVGYPFEAITYEFVDRIWEPRGTLPVVSGAAEIDGDTILTANLDGTVSFFAWDGGAWDAREQFSIAASRVWLEGDTAAIASSQEVVVFDREAGQWHERGRWTIPSPALDVPGVALEDGRVAVTFRHDVFFLEPVAEVSGSAWNDLDQDGLRTADEPPLAGVLVQLVHPLGPLLAEATTDAQGQYRLLAPSLDSRGLEVRVVPAPTLALSPAGVGGEGIDSDFDPLTRTVVLDGSASPRLDVGLFGTQPTARVVGQFWRDEGDGVRGTNGGEQGIVVQLLNERGWIVAETFTRADGSYRFESLAPGTYAVQFDLSHRPELTPTLANVGSDDMDSDVARDSGRSDFFVLVPGQEVVRDGGWVFRNPGALADLRITEVKTDELEYIELTNVGTQFAPLDTLVLRGGVDYAFGAGRIRTLGPGESLIVAGSQSAVEILQIPEEQVTGYFTRRLGPRETLELVDGVYGLVHTFRYDRDWFAVDARFLNFQPALEIVDPTAPLDAWNHPSQWRLSSQPMGSPGYVPLSVPNGAGVVVINELAPNPRTGPDWVELHNRSDQPIDVSHWFLGDTTQVYYAGLRRYQLPAGSIIAPHGYLVLNADETFGNPSAPGAGRPFGLSASGETLVLSAGDAAGNLLGTIDAVTWGFTQTNVVMGRHPVESGTSFAYAAFSQLATPTPGGPNAKPASAPFVISEIMHTPGFLGDAYVELTNVTESPQSLARWFLISDLWYAALEWAEPIRPGGQVLIVGTDVELFRTQHGIPADVPILRGSPVNVSDAPDRISFQLQGPGRWLDEVQYALDYPWPMLEAGASLERIDLTAFGNDSTNWQSSLVRGGTPGRPNAPSYGRIPEMERVCFHLGEFQTGFTPLPWDVNRDGRVTLDDTRQLSRQLGGSGPGDVNFDGRFDSTDLILLFQAGGYENFTQLVSWRQGDWNCDKRFTSTDLVLALQFGEYVGQ